VIGLKKGFEGQIIVKEGCQVAVDHYLPYKEKVEELRRKSAALPALPAGGGVHRARNRT
jgi:hypothetical protein